MSSIVIHRPTTNLHITVQMYDRKIICNGALMVCFKLIVNYYYNIVRPGSLILLVLFSVFVKFRIAGHDKWFISMTCSIPASILKGTFKMKFQKLK